MGSQPSDDGKGWWDVMINSLSARYRYPFVRDANHAQPSSTSPALQVHSTLPNHNTDVGWICFGSMDVTPNGEVRLYVSWNSDGDRDRCSSFEGDVIAISSREPSNSARGGGSPSRGRKSFKSREYFEPSVRVIEGVREFSATKTEGRSKSARDQLPPG